MGVFSIRVSPTMSCSSILSDADSAEDGVLWLSRERPTALKSAILCFGILLTAAAIAACVTVMIDWVQAAYFPTPPKLKAEFSAKVIRGSQWAHVAVATTAPEAAISVFDSSFARGSALLFLSEPVGSEALRQSQTSGFAPAKQTSRGLVVGMLLPESAPSDAHQVKAPLPRSRPFDVTNTRVKKDTADTAAVTATENTESGASPTAPSTSFTLLEKLFHFWHFGKDAKLPPEAGARTAVYDIEAHLVYLPNGEKLEAHSGMGQWLDDVRHVKEKGRGPTPPNTYNLALRKSLFHGVQAVRLNPVDGGKMYGRDGMLAHPYMLGPEGQSNGCVSIQEYSKFLEAFLSGEIDRLIVVSKLGVVPSYAANAFARDDKRYASR